MTSHAPAHREDASTPGGTPCSSRDPVPVTLVGSRFPNSRTVPINLCQHRVQIEHAAEFEHLVTTFVDWHVGRFVNGQGEGPLWMPPRRPPSLRRWSRLSAPQLDFSDSGRVAGAIPVADLLRATPESPART